MTYKQLKIVISGGGTGGHIFPAVAIADTLRERVPQADVLFIGALGRMEMQRVPQAGYPIIGLRISGLQRSLSLKNLSFPFKLIHALWTARKILREFKPDVVVGVGGYASGPTLRAAIGLKLPTLIQEQNSYPGITNKLLARKVNRICVAYENMQHWFPQNKTVLTGNPLRKNAIDINGKRAEALTYFGLSPDKTILLIVGGSQGARSINLAIANSIKELGLADLQIIWQTGNSYLDEAHSIVEAAGLADQVKPTAFISHMDLAYAAADLIISRAGAMAISEIAVVAKPVIFVPLPTAAEDHQTKNAKRLVSKNAAMLIENREALQLLVPTVISLVKNEKQRAEMSKNLSGFALPNASELIVDEILKLIEKP
jgi:UDP-N-acetylglucosamine--N-acetylmuramyl-(pentapeptide) pyrophosphoryl-undecaprenol N-acetylglucosamine transferase